MSLHDTNLLLLSPIAIFPTDTLDPYPSEDSGRSKPGKKWGRFWGIISQIVIFRKWRCITSSLATLSAYTDFTPK